MQSQQREPQRGREPMHDAAFRVVAAIVILMTTFSVLIMGIFATNAETPALTIIGSGVIIGGVVILVFMSLARLASRIARNRGRSAIGIMTMIYCLGASALLFGAWQGVQLWTQTPLYQEASLETPNSGAQF